MDLLSGEMQGMETGESVERKGTCIMDRFLTRRTAWIAAVSVLALSFLAMNVLTPYIADDYANLPPVFSKQTMSPVDMIDTALQSYQNWGGRFAASLFTAVFSCIPALMFDLLNTLAYLAATALIYGICKGNHSHSLVLYTAIHIMLWICVPDYGQVMFWMCGSANYLWTTIPILGMIYLYRKYSCSNGTTVHNPFWGILTFLLGIVAGCGIENSSAGMIVILTCYLIYFHFSLKIKIRFPIICGYAGSLIGFGVLIFAPGNQERLQASESLSLLFKFFVINYYWVAFVGILCILFIVLFYESRHMRNCDKKTGLQAGIFVIAAVFSAYCMLAAPTSPERTWFIVCIYMLCANGIIFAHLRSELAGKVKKGIILFTAGLFVITFVSMMDTMISSYEIAVQTKEREQYILEQKAQGNLDIITPVITHQYPLRSHHDALTGLSDIQTDPSFWINQVLADHYGVRSITGCAETKH